MAVALAFHAAAHLNHIELAPRDELTFHALHVGLVSCAGLIAAAALRARPRTAFPEVSTA